MPAYELRGAALVAELCAPAAFGPRRSERIGWLHVPKQGTTFLTTVLHHACDGLPPTASAAALLRRGSSNVWRDLDGAYNLTSACLRRRLLDRRRSAHWRPHVPARCTHIRRQQRHTLADAAQGRVRKGVAASCRKWESRLVTMMRSPAQRLLSGFYHAPDGPHGVMPTDRARVRGTGVAAYADYCPPVATAPAPTTPSAGSGASPGGGVTGNSSSSSLALSSTRVTRVDVASGGIGVPRQSLECIANQQCGYVLGRSCLSAADAQAATNRLRGPTNAFTFVGLAECEAIHGARPYI